MPGRGRSSVPTTAALEISEFFKRFFSSATYRENLKKRILAGKATHMEVLGHYYALGQPKDKFVAPPPPPKPGSMMTDVIKAMTSEEKTMLREVIRRVQSGDGKVLPNADGNRVGTTAPISSRP